MILAPALSIKTPNYWRGETCSVTCSAWYVHARIEATSSSWTSECLTALRETYLVCRRLRELELFGLSAFQRFPFYELARRVHQRGCSQSGPPN
jgi:hypothetical protein